MVLYVIQSILGFLKGMLGCFAAKKVCTTFDFWLYSLCVWLLGCNTNLFFSLYSFDTPHLQSVFWKKIKKRRTSEDLTAFYLVFNQK